ncbi:predicted protein [Postia placenta Mad-698-R]|nr:predicted protein [Postia placenta Mad-698-R]
MATTGSSSSYCLSAQMPSSRRYPTEICMPSRFHGHCKHLKNTGTYHGACGNVRSEWREATTSNSLLPERGSYEPQDGGPAVVGSISRQAPGVKEAQTYVANGVADRHAAHPPLPSFLSFTGNIGALARAKQILQPTCGPSAADHTREADDVADDVADSVVDRHDRQDWRARSARIESATWVEQRLTVLSKLTLTRQPHGSQPPLSKVYKTPLSLFLSSPRPGSSLSTRFRLAFGPSTRKPDLINRRKRFKSQRMNGVGEQPTLRLMFDGQHLHPGVVARDCRAYVRKDTGDTARPPRALEVASDARQVALGREATANTCTPAWLPGSAGPLNESSLAKQRDHRAMGRSPLCAVTCDGQDLHPGLVARVCGASERKLFGKTARLLRAGSVGSVRGHMRRPIPGVRSGCPGLRGLWRKLHWRNSKTTARRGGRLGVQLHATANTFGSSCHGRSGLEGLWGKLHWRKARLCHRLGFDDRPGAVMSSRMDSDDKKYKTHTHNGYTGFSCARFTALSVLLHHACTMLTEYGYLKERDPASQCRRKTNQVQPDTSAEE